MKFIRIRKDGPWHLRGIGRIARTVAGQHLTVPHTRCGFKITKWDVGRNVLPAGDRVCKRCEVARFNAR